MTSSEGLKGSMTAEHEVIVRYDEQVRCGGDIFEMLVKYFGSWFLGLILCMADKMG